MEARIAMSTIRAVSLLAWIALLTPSAARIAPAIALAAQQPTLTNDDVLALLKGGLSAPIVVAKIQSSACRFDTSPDALVTLRARNVPDSVLLAMVQAGPPVGRASAASSAPPNSTGTGAPGGIEDDGRTRVFVTDSQSWSTYGYSWLHGNDAGLSGGSVSQGGARPQTVEIIKTIGERCPEVVVTNQPPRATYVVTLDHEGGKGLLRVRNKVAVFNRIGDSIFSDSTLTLGEAVQRACSAIKKDSPSR
jgi:hypothetical protein